MAKESLTALRDFLATFTGAWNAQELEAAIKPWITSQKRGVGDVLWPMRVALSGREASPPPFQIAEILGKEKTLARIQYAIELANTL